MLRNKNISKKAEYSSLLAACLLAGGCATRPMPDAGFEPAAGHSMTQGAAARLAALAEKAIAEGRLIEGGNVYVSIVTAYPDDAHAWLRLGTVYLRTQQYAAAQMACERALRIDPGMSRARANLAMAHLHQLRLSEQVAVASTAVPEVHREALASMLRADHDAVTPDVATPADDLAQVLLPPADAR
jgi:tetratricopeptide (TPR) repeat protein